MAVAPASAAPADNPVVVSATPAASAVSQTFPASALSVAPAPAPADRSSS